MLSGRNEVVTLPLVTGPCEKAIVLIRAAVLRTEANEQIPPGYIEFCVVDGADLQMK